MKALFYTTMVAGLFACIGLQAASAKLSVEDFKKLKKMPITAEQYEALEVSCEDRGTTYTLDAGWYDQHPKKPKDLEKFLKKWKRKKELPVRITVDVTEQKKGSKPKKYLKGRAEIYLITVDEVKLIDKEKMSLSKLCPT